MRGNPTNRGPLRRGDVRESDGFRFRCYSKNKKGDGYLECWSSPEGWEKFVQRQKDWARRKGPEYRERIKGTPVYERMIERAKISANQTEAGRARKRAYKVSERGRANSREYAKKRWYSDPNYRLRNILRNRLLQAVKMSDSVKRSSILSIIDCPIGDLRKRLEATMPAGLTWQDVDVDHEIPCSFFNLADPRDVKACFSSSNMRLLPRSKNRSKGDRLPSFLSAAIELSIAY